MAKMQSNITAKDGWNKHETVPRGIMSFLARNLEKKREEDIISIFSRKLDLIRVVPNTFPTLAWRPSPEKRPFLEGPWVNGSESHLLGVGWEVAELKRPHAYTLQGDKSGLRMGKRGGIAAEKHCDLLLLYYKTRNQNLCPNFHSYPFREREREKKQKFRTN